MSAIASDWTSTERVAGSRVLRRPRASGENQLDVFGKMAVAADNPDLAKFHFRPSGNWTNNLAIMYATGTGARQDYVQAALWYREAAEKGDANAQYNLGIMYCNGRGVSRDFAEAARWFRKAADQDYADAQCNLAYLYESGSGVPQDNVEAARWYREAARTGKRRGPEETRRRVVRGSFGVASVGRNSG